MSYRSNHPKPKILRALIKQKGTGWNKATQELAPDNGQRVLEALVAEVGVEGAKEALPTGSKGSRRERMNTCFNRCTRKLRRGDWQPVLGPMHADLRARR